MRELIGLNTEGMPTNDWDNLARTLQKIEDEAPLAPEYHRRPQELADQKFRASQVPPRKRGEKQADWIRRVRKDQGAL